MDMACGLDHVGRLDALWTAKSSLHAQVADGRTSVSTGVIQEVEAWYPEHKLSR